MGNHVKDLVGQRFNRLTVIEDSGMRSYGVIKWRCKCDCGNECFAMGYQLKRGAIKSCGCYNRECMKEIGRRNGTDKVKMFNGTLDKNNTSGYKGVVWNHVCKRWVARITVDRKLYHLGVSKDIEECVKLRKRAEQAVINGTFNGFVAELKKKDENEFVKVN